jgi:hypothetical protein
MLDGSNTPFRGSELVKVLRKVALNRNYALIIEDKGGTTVHATLKLYLI